MKNIANRTLLFFIVSVLLIAGFLITNFLSYQAAKSTLRDNIINTSLPLTRDNIYSEIQRDIMLPVYVASMMANDTFLKDWVLHGEKDVPTIQKYLSEMKHKYNLFIAFYISEKSKSYYHENGFHKKISKDNPHDDWYWQFLSQHIPYELVIDKNEAANNALTLFINHRVYDYDKKLLGVTGVGLDLERISNLLAEYRVKYNRDIYLVDHSGIIKAHHDRSIVDVSNIHLMDGISKISEQILSVGQQSENFEYDRGNTHILLTKRYIPELRWFLVVEQNQDKAIENIWINFIKNSLLGLLVSLMVIIIVISSVNYYNRRLEKLAVTDELTGSYNRREFSRFFDKAVQNYKRSGQTFSIILLDIDKFKIINDTKGHSTGDDVIKAVTDICTGSIRDNDLIARWGGDEFILLVQGDAAAAKIIAERISKTTYDSPELSNISPKMPHVTLSMGIASYLIHDTEESITIRADKALYYAKENGRNRIETAPTPEVQS
jgi:diguanylate cyclase (GGDEF)-like protein